MIAMIENDRIERAMLEGYARGVKDGYADGYRDGWRMYERNRAAGDSPPRLLLWIASALLFAVVYLAALLHAWGLW